MERVGRPREAPRAAAASARPSLSTAEPPPRPLRGPGSPLFGHTVKARDPAPGAGERRRQRWRPRSSTRPPAERRRGPKRAVQEDPRPPKARVYSLRGPPGRPIPARKPTQEGRRLGPPAENRSKQPTTPPFLQPGSSGARRSPSKSRSWSHAASTREARAQQHPGPHGCRLEAGGRPGRPCIPGHPPPRRAYLCGGRRG